MYEKNEPYAPMALKSNAHTVYSVLGVIGLIFLTSFCSKLWIIETFLNAPFCFGDEEIYRLNAESFFKNFLHQNPHYPPLYSIAIAPAYFFKNWYDWMLRLNAFWLSLLVPATWFLARTLSLKTATWTAAIVAILPLNYAYPRYLLSENIFIPLATLAIALCLRGARRGIWEAFIFGVIVALAHLTKYLFLPAVPLLFVVYFYQLKKTISEKINKSHISLLLFVAIVGYCLAMGLWLIYGTYSGLELPKLLGLNYMSTGRIPENIFPVILMWSSAYIAYIILNNILLWPSITLWISQKNIKKNFINLSRDHKVFIILFILLLGGYFLVATRHSFISIYNYPEPLYILGRYLVHLVPLQLVLTFLLSENLKINLSASYFILILIIILIAVSIYISWAVLYDHMFWNFNDWFAISSFNTPNTFFLKHKEIIYFSLAIALLVTILGFIRRDCFINLLIIAFFVSGTYWLNKSYTMLDESPGFHGRMMAQALLGNSDKNTIIILDIQTDTKIFKSILNFFGIKSDLEILENIDLKYLDNKYTDIYYLSSISCGEDISQYILNNNLYKISIINKNNIASLRPKILSFNPKYIEAKVPFNVQPDGSSAAWLEVESISNKAYLTVDDQKLSISYGKNNIITASIPSDLLTTPRMLSLKLVDELFGLESEPITIQIHPHQSIDQ